MTSSPGSSRPPRRGRRIARLLLLAAVTLLLLEVVLQAGSFVVWLGQRQPAVEVEAGRDVVLCVGDSWTHGMGSSDPSKHSYPAVLQRLIADRIERDWLVVNGGQAGQNSRDVLERLPSQLEEFRPRLVCVLAGRNDYWSIPEELPADSAAMGHSQYRFRWRIPRLVAWVASAVAPGEAHAARVTVDKSGPEWQPRKAGTGRPYADAPRKWRMPETAREHLRAGRRAERRKDFTAAVAEFEAALQVAPDAPDVHSALAGIYRHAGQPDAAARHLQWLRASYERDGDYRTGRRLVTALSSCALHDEVVAVAAPLLQQYPEDGLLWRFLAQAAFNLGHHDDALRAVDESIRHSPSSFAFWLRSRICAVGRKDVREAIRSLLHGYLTFNDHEDLLDGLRSLSLAGLRRHADAALAGFECPEDVRRRLRAVIDEALAGIDKGRAGEVHSVHLRRIAGAVRAAGAKPVFLNYPLIRPGQEMLRETARELGVKFVDVRERFLELLDGRDESEVRAPDGHCNDEGYRFMAQAIFEGLQDLLAK